MCRFCKDHSIQSVPVRTNADIIADGFIALMADMGNGKEIVIHSKGIAYGIPVNYCPFCGEKFTGNEAYIDNYWRDA